MNTGKTLFAQLMNFLPWSTFTARQEIQDGTLVNVLAESTRVLPGFQPYYPTRRQLPLKLRCFLNFMGTRLKPYSRSQSRGLLNAG